ncbi:MULTISPECIES: hypothetical protein [unclassified Microcoleus]|uniref:hypothetical protein n=1 Tax=unclassified Microcoleus TaxID=2642155 RepID=UPI001DD32A58|nr:MULTISPECIES: hypothetical protein [unclassified Microcoleus]MCC3465557.1 hypothetical protein [Microcoleus sp. PH2017_06_SFM_O_A]MCC3411681.1 hypothetical protein [Microcoleus sp. PH2017_02_FOX_O_A]MCC3514345.1 hypothetical protein [Microcoleus sp. PH2017_18_LLB_O_A]MCC3532970.1 hypothetical protein [Microcoleus sp. PH2017_25_DOB_D_A]MCC3544929.1 hypothetical protein [Microcoleus sp. PH2017_24_DOB_U_A]
MTVYLGSKPLAEIAVNGLKEEQLQKINPKVVAAIQAIQAERMGKEPIAWADFSSHTTD